MMTLTEYRDEIDRLILTGVDESISNGSAAHAAIIIERMFVHADDCIRILTRTFSPRIYADPAVIRYADTFLAEPSHKVDIIVEDLDLDYAAVHPFIRLFLDRKNVEISVLDKNTADIVNVNFAVMDQRGVRFEDDKSKPTAIANFGDPNYAQKMVNYFNRVKSYSAPLIRHQDSAVA